MPYTIQPLDDFVEIQITGQPSMWELLNVLRQLRERDPRKKKPDVWIISEDTVFPLEWHTQIANTLQRLCLPDMAVGAKSAIVVCNEFQRAQFEMYRQQAQSLPFEVGVFKSRANALKWLVEDGALVDQDCK